MCFISIRKILGFYISVVNSSRRNVLKDGFRLLRIYDLYYDLFQTYEFLRTCVPMSDLLQTCDLSWKLISHFGWIVGIEPYLCTVE